MPDWVLTACGEYIKRMPRDFLVEIIEIKPEKRAAGNNAENIKAIEAKRILELAGKDYLVACDQHGIEINTLQLADKMQQWQMLGRDISIVIGGADGLHTGLSQIADFKWSLSKLTLPHAFVRVLLTEQLYRAYSVIQKHPYHRE